MTYKKIADYGVIGDGKTVALIGADGSVDWMCLPNMDSPSVFAAVLDNTRGGAFRITPDDSWGSAQSYLDQTNILKTRFRTRSGQVELLDFMPLEYEGLRDGRGSLLIRRLEGISGSVSLGIMCSVRFDYGRFKPEWQPADDTQWMISHGDSMVTLWSSRALWWENERSEVTIGAGDTLWLVITEGRGPPAWGTEDLARMRERTVAYWRTWVREQETGKYPVTGFWRDILDRSALVLKLLQFRESGAIAAAPTCSIPTIIYGQRNWDYRFTWIRDTSMTLDTLFELGHTQEVGAYMSWLEKILDKQDIASLNVLYRLSLPEPPSGEKRLDHLEGYKGSSPVLTGQFNIGQTQHDIYGELLNLFFSMSRIAGKIDPLFWGYVKAIVDHVVRIWRMKDHGIWELRTGPHHVTHSKLMCWVALDRGIKIAEHYGFPADIGLWKSERRAVHADILEKGYNRHRGSFTQHYDTEELDASLLRIPLMGFLPVDDPRVANTIRAVEEELLQGGVVRRYNVDDGLPGKEHGFLICLFWYLRCLIRQKRFDEVEAHLRRMDRISNHLGLFGEQYDPVYKEITGNIPHAFSHIGYATTVLEYLDARQPRPELWRKTLDGLDFLVCIDRQFTADAAYADIVLPATTHYEIESYMVYGSLFRLRERMIEPVGEARSDFFILAELADRLGYGHLFPQTEREMLDHVLKGSGFTYEDVKAAGGTVSIDTRMMQYRKWEKGLLRKDGKPGFDTPSGKFEIASSVLEEYGYDPLPVFTPPAEGPMTRPDLAERYPLVFNSGARLRTSFHTQHHGIRSLNRHRPSPAVTINTGDAGARGIKNGDRVRITTPRGAIFMRARVTDDMAPGSIDANHACGGPLGPEDWRNTNVNDLTDLDQYDPISGFPVYKSLLCEVAKAEAAGRQEIGSEELSADEIPVARQEQAPAPGMIYLDHNATTPMDHAVMEAVAKAMEAYGNPSSIHSQGIAADKMLDEARRNTAGALGCTARRVVFTGGGTEAANLAIKGVAARAAGARSHIITSAIEHPAVLNTCRWLETKGYSVTYLGVDETGRVRPEDLIKAISRNTLLVSIMSANNETGVIQPIRELARIAKAHGALFHTDAVQAFGKIAISLDDIDLLSISAHKVYGPKGVGALYVAKGVDMEALVHGGGQEFGLRSGTENIPGIVGLGRAAKLVPGLVSEAGQLQGLRDRLEAGIGTIVPDCRVNGHRQYRLPNTLNITLPGFRGESVVLEMARRGICFSSGSACHSGSSEPAHVLLAMGLSAEEAHCALRFSLGRHSTGAEVDTFLDQLDKTLTGARNIVHFVPCR